MSTRRAALRASSAVLRSGQTSSSSTNINALPAGLGGGGGSTTSATKTSENDITASDDLDESDLSSVPSDIEDVSPFFEPITPTKKRKRKVEVREGPKVTTLSFGSSIQKFRHKDAALDNSTSGFIKAETKDEDREEEEGEELPRTPKKENSRKPVVRTPKKRAGVVPAPKHWEEIFNRVREMRKLTVAPVDTMGCERLALGTVSAKDQRFQTLIALMLSSQTKDTVNAVAMNNLQTQLPGGLNLQSILQVQPAELDRLIRVVGFHNRKTEYIKKTAEILRDNFAGDIPDTIEGLTSLPGVGPKMGYLCLSAAWDKTEGIGVDVHVHRITNLWKWNKTTTPEETRAALESWLPKDLWREINHMLVGFGQTICLPRGPKCDQCTLSKGLCPAAFTRSPKKKVIKKIKVELEGTGGLKHELVEEDGDDLNMDAEAVKWEIIKKEEEEDDDAGSKIDRQPGLPPPPPPMMKPIKTEIEETEVLDLPDVEQETVPVPDFTRRTRSKKKTTMAVAEE